MFNKWSAHSGSTVVNGNWDKMVKSYNVASIGTVEKIETIARLISKRQPRRKGRIRSSAAAN